MGVSPNDTASQQRNLAGAAAVAIAAAPTAMAEPAAVQQPPAPVAVDAGWPARGPGGGPGGWHGGGPGGWPPPPGPWGW
jgi:hypothetical protein